MSTTTSTTRPASTTAAREPGWRGAAVARRAVRVARDHLLPAARRDRHARRHRPGHGAVRLQRDVPAADELLLHRLLRPAALRGPRRHRRRRRQPHPGPHVEASRGAPARRVDPAPDARVLTAGRQRQRQPQLDRRRRPAGAALRVRQDRPRPVRRDRPGQEAAQAGRVHARRRAPDLPGRRPAAPARPHGPRPGHRAGPAVDPRRHALRVRGPDPHVRHRRRVRGGRSRAPWSSTSGNRMGRISTWLAGACSDPNGTGFQTCHGLYALADGGWWGVGLGASREKWQWLPEAHNDFIFSIIGEELGLPGTLAVLGLFAVLALACYRLVAAHRRLLRPHRQRGRHGLDPRPGDHQHRLGHRRAAGHRGAAAAGVRRRVGARHDDVRRSGMLDLVRPQRAGLP